MKRRVVITGLGIITPCGVGWKPYWESAVQGKSHIQPIQQFSLNGFPSKLAGQVTDFAPAQFVKNRKSLKVMSREIQLAVAASHLAIQDSRLELTDDIRTRFGVSLGTGIINNDLDEVGVGIRNGIDEQGRFQMKKFGKVGIHSMYPLWFLKYLPNMPACHVSINHGLKGPSNSITTSSAASAQAIGEAFRVIERGDADFMLAGGTDSKLNAMGISRFHLLGLLSQKFENPEKAYCPFDERRDGLILGEGAGLLVLEALEQAEQRGARIYGEIVGYGSSSDFNYDPRKTEDYNGKRVAMSRALEDSRLNPEEIDLIVANGSGIPQEDIQEARALNFVFKNTLDSQFVTGFKPITGHLVYGSGGVEAAAAALSLHEGLSPALTNLENADPECSLPFIHGESQTMDTEALLFNSFGFGGQNASLVLKKV